MTRNVVGSVQVLSRDATFTGMQPTPVVLIEWKVPAFGFADPDIRKRYYRAASDNIDDLSSGRHPRDNT